MLTGFNPFAIPNVPNMPAMPMPKIDPNAGLTALLAVQNAIARQQAMAARAAGHGGGGGGTNPRYTNYIDLPNGKGGFDTVPVVGADKEGREARAKQLWNQRINQLASQDKDLAESLSKIGTLSVRGQKAERDKIRQQYLPKLFKEWNLSPDQQADAVKMLTADINVNIDAQQKAIDNTGVFQSLADNAKMGWYSLRDAFKSIGKTPEEKFIIDQQRSAERQAILDSNPHLREEELRSREGNDSWTDFFEKPVVNAAEAVGDMIAGAGTLMAGQAGGAAAAGALLRAIPTPLTQGAATAIQLGGAALGGAAAGAPLGGIALRDRLISEMNAGNLTREQVLAGIENGETGAQLIGALTGGIPLGVAQTGLPLISRGANTMLGRRYIQNQATKAAAERLATTAAPGVAQSQINAAAEAMGQNALRDALAQQASKGFLRRYAETVAPTALDLGALSALNTMGSNYAYGNATGQPVDITQGAGGAFLSGAAMGPVFGVLNARRPYVPAQRPVPELPNINTDAYRPIIESAQVLPETGGLPGGSTGPTQRAAGPTASGTRPQGPQSGPTGGGAQQQYRQQTQQNYQRQQTQQQQNTTAQYKSYAEWKRFYESEQTTNPQGGAYAQPQREQFVNASDYYRARREHDFNHSANAENLWRGWAEGTGPEGYYGGDYTASWNGYGGKRGYSTRGTDVVSNIAKKYAGQGNRSALKVKNNITDALARNDITLDDVMRVADTYAKTDPILYSNLRRAADDYVQQWDNARRSAEQKQQQAQQQAQQGPQQQARQAAEPNPAAKVAPNSKQAKENAASTLRGVSPEMQEAQLKNIFYQMLYNEAINPGSMRLIVKNSHLTPQQRIWAEEAIRNFERYAPEIRKQVDDYARGRQEAIDTGSPSSRSGAAPSLGGDELPGQGGANRTDTVGDSAAATNTQTNVADIANEYLERLARGDNPLAGRGDAWLSTQNPRTLAAFADIVGSSPVPLRNEQQGSNRKSGSGQPTEQPAQPDKGQRSNQPPASPGKGSDGTPESDSGNQPNNVNGAAEYPSSVLDGHPNLTTESAIALDQILDVAINEKYTKTQTLRSVKEWANNMLKSGEPVQEVREAFGLFSSLPQLHKSMAKAVNTILEKAENKQEQEVVSNVPPAKNTNEQPTAATTSKEELSPAEQKIMQALEGVGNFETYHAVNLERAEQGSLLDNMQEKVQEDNTTQEEITRRGWDAEQEKKAEEQARLAGVESTLVKEIEPYVAMVGNDVKLSAKDKNAIDTALNKAINAGLPEKIAKQRVQFLYEALGIKPEVPAKKPNVKSATPETPLSRFIHEIWAIANLRKMTPEITRRLENAVAAAYKAGVPEDTIDTEVYVASNIPKISKIMRSVAAATLRDIKNSQTIAQPKQQPKTEIEYAQSMAEVREQLDNLPNEILIDKGSSLFPGESRPNAIERATDIMWDKAAGKTLSKEETKIYNKLLKLKIKEIDPVITKNAEAAAEQGKKLDMNTTPKGQAVITRRSARKKVNDSNSEYCKTGK